MTHFARRALLAVWTAFVMSACVAGAEPSLSVTGVGWDGRVFLGRWSPLRVKLSTDSVPQNPRFEVTAPDADGQLAIVPQAGIPLSGDGEFELSVRPGRLNSSIAIKAFDGETPIASTSYRFSDSAENSSALKKLDTRLAAVLCPEIEFGQSIRAAIESGKEPSSESEGPRSIAILTSPNSLPVELQNWESLSVLVISGEFGFSESQILAIREWVGRGGELVLSIGGDVESYSESGFSKWIPVRASDSVRLRDLSTLESFASHSNRINPLARLRASRLEFDRGVKLIDSLDGTIAARVSYGFGHVTLVGFELHRPPLSEWESLPEFVGRLAFPPSLISGSEPERVNQHLTDSGISELTTQVNLAQQNFSEIERGSTWAIIGALSIYLLIVGPLDYLLVHRILKKPELTWVTFPILLLGMMAVSLWAGQTSNSSPLQINQIDIVDVEESLQRVAIRSRMSAYSPATQRAAVTAQFRVHDEWNRIGNPDIAPSASKIQLDWDSIPEDGFRGLYRKSGLEFSTTNYRFSSDLQQIENLPVFQWSTRSLAAEQHLTGQRLIESDLTASTVGNLSGSLTHYLPGPLTDWILVYRSRVYFPRPTIANATGIPLEPNRLHEPTRVDLSASRDLKGFLTKTRQIRVQEKKGSRATPEEKIVTERAPYDPFSNDLDTILRILSFHEAAGGKNYTGLNNHASSDLDWSRLLDEQHAVLYGSLDAEIAQPVEWSWNDSPATLGQRTVIVRFYLPVTLEQDTRRELPKLDD